MYERFLARLQPPVLTLKTCPFHCWSSFFLGHDKLSNRQATSRSEVPLLGHAVCADWLTASP